MRLLECRSRSTGRVRPWVLAILLAACCIAGAAEKPNIIFIISDDQRWDCLGAAGNPNIHTPHLDRLAREGIHFTDATIHIPQCSPSRAALITGQAAHANGRYSNQSVRTDVWNPEGFDQYHCLPEAMAEAGYVTALVGKWHLYARPWRVGFQKVGTWMPWALGPYKGAPLAQGHSTKTVKNEEFTQTAFGDSARQILREHMAEATTQPLFLWLAFTAPHTPYKPNPASAMKHYEGKSAKDVVPPDYQGDLDQPDAKHWVDYVTAITAMDEEIGRLMQTLEETGHASNTVVFFLGDNGYMMGSRGMNGKGQPWEESIRVPLIAWGPGVLKARGKSDAAASSLDLPPTFVRLAGGVPPREWHGRDLAPVLAGESSHDITWSITTTPDYRNHKFPGMSYRAVRTTSTKLIVWHESVGKSPELYDLRNDPHETRNLFGNKAMKAERDRLGDILKQWMAETGDDWTMKEPVMPTGLGSSEKKEKTPAD